ncbi:MAG: hypothetical protein M3542_01705 [Acidobacteriota bacterium]|nr:hypothetical protein [Acidobacteriota bacterium]MDQ5871065.1 hypothetical protein [Acidobacteriota bacterium]
MLHEFISAHRAEIINRKGERRPDGPTPEVELRDLAGLDRWLRTSEA